MSTLPNAAHAAPAIRPRLRRMPVVLALTLAVAAAALPIALVAIGGSSDTTGSPGRHQAAMRSDGGPEESALAASVGSRPTAGGDESATAASIGAGAARPAGGPDEASVAASVASPTTRSAATSPDNKPPFHQRH